MTSLSTYWRLMAFYHWRLYGRFIQLTIDLAKTNVEQGGRPFACLIVKGGEILAESANRVAKTHDLTAHAATKCQSTILDERCPFSKSVPRFGALEPSSMRFSNRLTCWLTLAALHNPSASAVQAWDWLVLRCKAQARAMRSWCVASLSGL
jgi:hypothetical protein